MRHFRVYQILLGISLIAGGMLGIACGGDDDNRYEYIQIRMGVPFQIVLYSRDEATANQAAQAAYRRITELNAIMSDYDPESELSRLCQSSGPDSPAVTVSNELFDVLREAQTLSRKSDGAFDVTVGPVVKLWRKARRKGALPLSEQLENARQLIGYRSLILNQQDKSVRLLKSNVQLDLGGIAKGYAADEAIAVLKQHGIESALIDASGDITCSNAAPKTKGWRVGIVSRKSPDQKPELFLLLSNMSVATSGDAYQATVIDGVRYSHIVDPTTGVGLTRPMTVSVIAPTGSQADSLASAVSVLGPEQGLALIENTPHTAARIVELHGQREVLYESKRWQQFVAGDE